MRSVPTARALALLGGASALALASVLLAPALARAVECEYMDNSFCQRVRLKCVHFDEGNCSLSGGHFVERGGFCSYCNLCAKFVGAGEACNVTVEAEREGGARPGAAALTAVCRAPLVCSRRQQGACVLPDECRS